jgi:DNA replication protein DnaC
VAGNGGREFPRAGRVKGYNTAMAGQDEVVCAACGGSGWRIERREGYEFASPCPCRGQREPERLLRAAGIPERYLHCTVESFELWDPGNPSLGRARKLTQEFIDEFPARQRGLLYYGNSGTGKTHLAVAALRELILHKGVRGRYVNLLELVQRLMMAFDAGGAARQDLLEPVIEADVLVLDELGAGKVTPWVLDLLYYVINSRYMSQRLTLCTTNYKDGAAAEADLPPDLTVNQYRAAIMARETLADRIGVPLRSRLYEMCEEIWLQGRDYRQARVVRQGRRA